MLWDENTLDPELHFFILLLAKKDPNPQSPVEDLLML